MKLFHFPVSRKLDNVQDLLQKITADLFKNKTFQKVVIKMKELAEFATDEDPIIKYQISLKQKK